MAKKVVGQVKLNVPAGQAKPSPPIGPALGQRGLNIMEFCKQFNARTQDMEPGVPLPVLITAYHDRSFTFDIKTPTTTFYLKRAAKISGGSAEPRRKEIGTVTKDQIREIAEAKMPDLNCYDMDTAMNMVMGSARSMGIRVVE